MNYKEEKIRSHYSEIKERHDIKQLASSIADHYFGYAKKLKIKTNDLIEAAIDGAAYGYYKFETRVLEKYKNKSPYKLNAYLTWWMRFYIHKILVKEIMKQAKVRPKAVEKVLLSILEEE